MFLVCKFLADREQFRAFLFLVCIFFADQEHLGAYAGALISNCRVAGKLMWRASVCCSQTYPAVKLLIDKRLPERESANFDDSLSGKVLIVRWLSAASSRGKMPDQVGHDLGQLGKTEKPGHDVDEKK